MGRILFVTVLLLALTGCPFYLHAPPGGSIVSQSGTYSCAAGKTCEIPITDTNFNELFVADPAPGYIFVHWKKRNRGICAYKQGPCRITSGPFEGKPKLLRLLDTNQALNLEAVFSPTSPDDAEVVNTNSSACYNEELLTQGTRYLSTAQTYLRNGNMRTNSGRTEEDQMISGQVDFEGRSTMLSTRETRPLPEGSPTTITKEYFTADTPNKSFTTFGTELEEQGPTTNITRQVFDPGLTTRFNLKPGETYSQTITSNLTIINNDTQLPTTSSELTVVTTYLGRQEITVPAGRFNTCRFELVITTFVQGQELVSTNWLWFAVDDGVLVREWIGTEDRQVSSEFELESGTLNGRTL